MAVVLSPPPLLTSDGVGGVVVLLPSPTISSSQNGLCLLLSRFRATRCGPSRRWSVLPLRGAWLFSTAFTALLRGPLPSSNGLFRYLEHPREMGVGLGWVGDVFV